MIWSRRVEDMIYHIYHVHCCTSKVKQMENLKHICMNEINAHEELKDALKEDTSLAYFIIQMALENINI